jgi:hypothetical protein
MAARAGMWSPKLVVGMTPLWQPYYLVYLVDGKLTTLKLPCTSLDNVLESPS